MKASYVFSGFLLTLASALTPISSLACTGYSGPGGACSTGPGDGASTGPRGGASTGMGGDLGGDLYTRPGGGASTRTSVVCYYGPGGGGTDQWNRPSPACN